ncbi:MAG: [protein-PII] uridylyltransferase, partial [Gammaproteobacteria bacterium]
WNEAAPGRKVALFATGGYGRRELYPGSDIDLAVVLGNAGDGRAALETFVRRLWDLGLKAGIGVRTLAETRDAAAADAATYTALTEARRLVGERSLVSRLDELLADKTLWPLADYIKAKRTEQRERYARYGDSTQRLEPSVKESPGGMRDLATLSWLAAKHLGKRRAGLQNLERANLISAEERRTLTAAARTLARIRLALHHLAGRGEDRLLFDLQPRVAELLGYRAQRGTLAVERLMQDYYRAATTVARSLALVFASLEAAPAEPRALTPGLVARGKAIDFDCPERPRETPALLLGIFRRWQQEPKLDALAPSARRAIAAALPCIDADFRHDPTNRANFLALLTAPNRVADAFFAMHDAGVLDRYLPAFARIAGRMQYDLFHIFTVDEHVLRVLANVEALLKGRFQPAREDLRSAAARIDRPEIIYLAALFHDIAKGRGGDHSTLGARDAQRFALAHGLAPADADLAAWLVRHHLALSITAQKSDLSDPRVIAAFARLAGDQRRLDYLYVLTAADVQATNPSLWNAWRSTLFGELYQASAKALWRGLSHPVDARADIAARKREVRALIGGGNPMVKRLWHMLGDDYFLQYQAEEIVWHTRALLAVAGPPAVFLRPAPGGAGTAVAVYCTRRSFAFARVTAVLAQLGLSIAAARCVPVGTGETLDTYLVFEADGSSIEDERQLARAETLLAEELAREAGSPRRVTRPTPRQVRLFRTPTRISFTEDSDAHHSVLELHAGDHPGLLAAVARAFKRCGIYLSAARVMTVGERAEDVFHLTDSADRPLDAATQTELETLLHEEIASEF